MKYIDSKKLIAEIGRRKKSIDECPFIEAEFGAEMRREGKIQAYNEILSFITSLQQEQPKGNLEYWLEHFGMPKENIDNCITQIAQGYGACRYLDGIQHGAEAVNELAKQEQPEVELENYISNKLRELGADLINHKPYSFNHGLNVGKTNAYHDILDRLNARKK